jgi:rubrerythrin
MAEASYRSTVLAGGKNQKSLTKGWETLGLDRETAQRIWDEQAKEGFLSEREVMYGGQTTKYDKKGRRLGKDGKPEDFPKEGEGAAGGDNDSADDSGSAGPVSNVYECSQCGFTIFVAQGRESKFFGNDFKCPECGAPKEKFEKRDDFGED